jgi:hypothetical protein
MEDILIKLICLDKYDHSAYLETVLATLGILGVVIYKKTCLLNGEILLASLCCSNVFKDDTFPVQASANSFKRVFFIKGSKPM